MYCRFNKDAVILTKDENSTTDSYILFYDNNFYRIIKITLDYYVINMYNELYHVGKGDVDIFTDDEAMVEML